MPKPLAPLRHVAAASADSRGTRRRSPGRAGQGQQHGARRDHRIDRAGAGCDGDVIGDRGIKPVAEAGQRGQFLGRGEERMLSPSGPAGQAAARGVAAPRENAAGQEARFLGLRPTAAKSPAKKWLRRLVEVDLAGLVLDRDGDPAAPSCHVSGVPSKIMRALGAARQQPLEAELRAAFGGVARARRRDRVARDRRFRSAR